MIFCNQTFWLFIYLFAILAITIWAYKSELLRDESEYLKEQKIPRPFSWSRTQMYWWTIIILSSFIIVSIQTNLKSSDKNNPKLQFFPYQFNDNKTEDNNSERNTNVFIFIFSVLGIGVANSVTARFIESNDLTNLDENGRPQRIQDMQSKGFWLDITSNNNGPSIQRVQAVLFNGFFGIHYVYSTLKTGHLHSYDNPEYIFLLLGVSTSAYLIWKNKENKKQGTTPSTST